MKLRIKDLTESDIKTIFDMYNDGVKIIEICNKMNICKSSFWRLKNERQWPCQRHQYTKNKTEESYVIFQNKFVHSSIINPDVHTNDYRTDRIRYTLDEEYFDCIDNQNKAYFLGFLLADGSIHSRTMQISLQESDKYILERFLDELKCDSELRFLDYNSKNPNWSNQYYLTVTSEHICNSLKYYNVTPNKSLSLKFPTTLDFNLCRHLIRGYMDGDGSIRKPKSGSRCGDKAVTFISTESFCNDLKLIIENYLDINCSIMACHDSSKPTRELSIRGGRQCKVFLDWIYKDANLYLTRKYNLYQMYYA